MNNDEYELMKEKVNQFIWSNAYVGMTIGEAEVAARTMTDLLMRDTDGEPYIERTTKMSQERNSPHRYGL